MTGVEQGNDGGREPTGNVEASALQLIEEVLGLLDLDEFHRGLLGALRRVIPSRWVSLNDIGPGPGDVTVIAEPELPAEAMATFVRLHHENPLIQRYERTRDGRAYRFSDVISRAELHRLTLYREFYGQIGAEHQMAFTLPAAPDRILGVAMSRTDPDFSDHERAIVERSRPALIQVFRNAIAHGSVRPLASGQLANVTARLRATGLSERQAGIVARLASGQTPREIAGDLGISGRTVAKHLQLAYRALGVRGRAEAVARALRLLDGDSPAPAPASGPAPATAPAPAGPAPARYAGEPAAVRPA